MKRSSKNLIGKPITGFPNVDDVTCHEIGIASSVLTVQTPSSYPTIFAEGYDVLLWMNENIKQLDKMLDRLI